MCKPVLVVMAAGMGSRYGGLKQIDPVGPNGQAIMDYSLFDAMRAGFEEVVFIISQKMADDGFEKDIKARVNGKLNVRCAVQQIDDLPEGYTLPEGRVKPWGTAHAVRSCRGMFNAPFAAVNADDFYGRAGFEAIYQFLIGSDANAQPRQYAMVGYNLSNTLTENGHVARGICKTDDKGYLTEITERTHIISTHEGPLYTEDGQVYYRLEKDAPASMNLWGFTADFLGELDSRFAAFLDKAMVGNPLKGEYFLPGVVDSMLQEGKAQIQVLPCESRWYGVTYREDKPVVVEAIRKMTEEGLYPESLWA